jgi:hypothetical protein
MTSWNTRTRAQASPTKIAAKMYLSTGGPPIGSAPRRGRRACRPSGRGRL